MDQRRAIIARRCISQGRRGPGTKNADMDASRLPPGRSLTQKRPVLLPWKEKRHSDPW